ncbi:50S ribosomal protein L29 [Candidatus Uhrbacteria bacterium]|nr:50S ribosomal protein L29 [Candidatus Uhrbacteria bacterium]
MDIKDLRTKSDPELHALLLEQRTHLEDLRFRASTRELKNVHEIAQTRRLIARILTAFHERASARPVAA